MAIRREVLRDNYVDKTIQAATGFTRPMQHLVTENCWGEACGRAVLPGSTRSLITIAKLAALKARTELKGHVRVALRNGCTVVELQEVLVRSAVYWGVPVRGSCQC